MTRYCVRDGSGNPTLLGVDCIEQPDPWGTPKKNASKLMNAFLYNFILVPPLGARGLILSNLLIDILYSFVQYNLMKFL